MPTLLLVQPPQPGLLDGFSNALVSLANYVSSRVPSAEVRIVDLGTADANSAERILKETLNSITSLRCYVGVTTTTASYQSALAVARAVKRHSPDHRVVFGGHHASPQHDVVLRNHADIVDIVVRGEGERAITAIIEGTPPTLAPGVSTIENGLLHVNPPAPPLPEAELDSIAVDFHGALFKSAPGKFDRATYVSARGCPLRCAFCAVAGEPIRAKSVGRVVEDLYSLIAERGYSRLAIEDNFFAHKRARTVELCLAIKDLRSRCDLSFTWDCQTRVESLSDPEVVKALAGAGCDEIYLGVEALSAEELLHLGKTARPERYIEQLMTVVAPLVLGNGIQLNINLQVGVPVETPTSKAARLTRLRELGSMADRRTKAITIFPQLNVIYPGTSHFWKSVEQHLFGHLGNEVFETFTAWEATEQPILTFLGENFAHGVGGIPVGILDGSALRNGEFRVNVDAVNLLKEELFQMNDIPGIRVFRYGKYLARTHSSESETLCANH